MSSGNTKKRVLVLLEAPFRPKRSKSSGPSATSVPASNTPTNNPDTTVLSNVISGSRIRASASPSNVAGPAENHSPNPQPPGIFVPMKNEGFKKAILQYIDTLSNEDREAFRSASDVMEKLGELRQRNFRTSSSLNTRKQRVQKVLQCVRRFLDSIKISIQHSPEISSLVVGGLHCILTVSIVTDELLN